jgi:hypothetical protein
MGGPERGFCAIADLVTTAEDPHSQGDNGGDGSTGDGGDTSARQRVWRSRRRILVGAFLTALGAALATQAVTWLDQGVSSVFGDDEPSKPSKPSKPPEPLIIRADPLTCSALFTLPDGVSVPEMQRKVDELTGGDERVMEDDWDGFRKDLSRLGADFLIEHLDLVVRSSLSDDVVLKRIRIEVVERSETDSVPSFTTLGGCGELPEHHYAVDFDDARPRLSPATFSYTVHKRDTVRIRLKLNTAHTDCRWRLHLDWDGPQGAETTTLPGGKATYRSYPVPEEGDADVVVPGWNDVSTDFPFPGKS